MPDNPLLSWTLDAKRALQRAEQLSSHANNLVRDSAASLDRAESYIPKCIFLKEALKGQVVLLERFGSGCYAVEEHARREFEVFIKDLDSLDIDLNEILGRLKSVALDPGFDAVNPIELRQNPPRKSLHDFVDEQGIEDLKAQLRQVIDEVQDSHEFLSSSLTTLSTEVKETKNLVDSIQPPIHLPTLSPSTDSLKSQTYSTHPEKQDFHAHYLALLLTSLAQHYDQTSSALKDNEIPLGQISDIDPETLEILSKDASEVTEVLEEMEHHVREIERSSDVLLTHAQHVQDTYTSITNTFTQIEEYGKSRLPQHLSSVKEFESRAALHRQHIRTLKEEMFNLVQHYTNFSSSYTALLVEVRRRTEAQVQTQLFVNEITTRLTTLFEQESRARQAFMGLHATYLPEDLWKGIYDPPAHAAIQMNEGGTLPVLRDGVGGTKRLSSLGMEKRRSAQVSTMGGSGESTGKRSIDSSGRRSGESSSGKR